MTFWCGFGSTDPYLVTNGSGSDSFCQETLGMFKKISYFFLITYPQAYYLQSYSYKSNFLLKLCVKILFCKHYFSPLKHLYEKRKGFGSGSVPLTNGSRSGRPKNIRIPYTDRNNFFLCQFQCQCPVFGGGTPGIKFKCSY
jgi:hypothetical protein